MEVSCSGFDGEWEYAVLPCDRAERAGDGPFDRRIDVGSCNDSYGSLTGMQAWPSPNHHVGVSNVMLRPGNKDQSLGLEETAVRIQSSRLQWCNSGS